MRSTILTNTITESIRNFAELLEKERVSRGMSQKEMADALDISFSSYRRILSGESTKIPMEMIINAHRLTGMWLYQMLGDSTVHTKSLDKYMLLDAEDQEIIRRLIEHLYERRK